MPEIKPTDRFISFEGIDGAGKSTHIRWFADELGTRVGRDQVVLTREPGGTALGERLRDLLLAQAMHADTEALLMFAARAEHLAQVISPALAAGHWVLSDRFTDASYAYQGGGRGIARARLQHLEQFTHADRQPKLTVLFDVDPLIAAQRRHGVRDADKFEAEALDFHRRTRHAYLARVAENPNRFAVVDAAGTPEQVQNELKVILYNITLNH